MMKGPMLIKYHNELKYVIKFVFRSLNPSVYCGKEYAYKSYNVYIGTMYSAVRLYLCSVKIVNLEITYI